MKTTHAIRALIGISLLASTAAFGQRPQGPPTDTVAPNIPGVVAAGTKVQFIKDGFEGTEGPIGLPDGTFIFTETNASRITKIAPDGSTSIYLDNTNGSNGLALDSKGRLISVQTVPGNTKVGVIHPKGSEKILADNFEGKPFGRPNDLVVDKKGGVYFTEPANVDTPALPSSVYHIRPDGSIIRVAEGITFPNGIQLSPDEKTLYVNDAQGPHLIAFDVQGDGTLTNRRNFAQYEGVAKTATGVRSGADGLAIDSEGRIYSGTMAGVEVFSPQGRHLGTIPLSRAPQNLAFAGADKKTLYVVGRGSAFKIQMLSQGFQGRAK